MLRAKFVFFLFWTILFIVPFTSFGYLNVKFENGPNTAESYSRVFSNFHRCIKIMDTGKMSRDSVVDCADKFINPKLSLEKRKKLARFLFFDLSLTVPSPCLKQGQGQEVLCFTIAEGKARNQGRVTFVKDSGIYYIDDIKAGRN